MMRFQRPKPPENFETTVKGRRDDVKKAIDEKKAPKFEALWSAFKPIYSEAQGGKCGYCDIAVTGAQDGDVEHYAPKSEIAVLGPDEKTWGQEARNSSRVSGRKPVQLSDAGYWWLAYDWSNYLLACAVCNQKWKGTVFPVKEPPPRTVPPAHAISERTLLLNPFGGADPAKHLRFNEDGSVEPLRNSRRGRETIKTVGLDRPSIRNFRRFPVSDAYEALNEHTRAHAVGDEEGQRRALLDLVRLGGSGRQFAGCVRAVAQQELRLSWTEIEAATT